MEAGNILMYRQDHVSNRRQILRVTPILIGTGSIAGCLRLDTETDSSEEDTEEDAVENSDDSTDDTREAETSEEPTDSDTTDDAEDTQDELGDNPLVSRADEFLMENNANEHNEMLDFTGEDMVSIEVGAGENGFAFIPAGIVIDAGTTVSWTWTGRGGSHNVVSEPASDFEFESARTDEEGHTFTQSFNEQGLVAYVCTPHRAQAKYGAIAVL